MTISILIKTINYSIKLTVFYKLEIRLKNKYNFDKGNDVARIYWIEKLLPDIYADIFTHAMMYNRDNLDQIETTARKLNEVLKQ